VRYFLVTFFGDQFLTNCNHDQLNSGMAFALIEVKIIGVGAILQAAVS
jgi:hypothetical protein